MPPDDLPGYARDIADHMLDLHIHLGQRLVHVLDVLVGHHHLVAPMPHQGSHRAYLRVRPKGRSQQSYRMQKL